VAAAPVVLSACADADQTFSTGVGKLSKELNARGQPLEVLIGFPERSRLRVPGEMKKCMWLDFSDECSRRSCVKQIDAMPNNISRNTSGATDSVHLIAVFLKMRNAMPADKSTGTGDENSFHSLQSS
jgi:hypothetical protein